MIKRLLDVVAAGFGLVLLAPLLLLIAIAIKVDSAGPVFFRQTRVGRHGSEFRIFKFRTMAHFAQPQGPQITPAGDARVTRVGAFLRRYKLDELPQLIDVFRGTMSLVGPRPEVPRYVAEYSAPHRERLLGVRPGITDFASLKYRNEAALLARVSDPEREYVDVILPAKLRVAANSVEHASLAADLHVLGLTMRTVFVPDGPFRKVRSIMGNTRVWSAVEGWMQNTGKGHRWMAVVADAAIVLACWHITYLFRLGFERWQPGRPWYDDYVSIGIVAAYLVCLQLAGARSALWRYFAFEDFRRLLVACVCAGLAGAVTVLMAGLVGVARAVLVLHPVFVLVGLTLARLSYRMLWEHAHALATGDDVERRYAIVLGAGEVSRRLIAGLHDRHGWHVLMLLDDDAKLHGMRVAGIPVRGPLTSVRDPSLTAAATHAIVAIDDGDTASRSRAFELAQQSGLIVLGVPSPGDLAPQPTAATAG